MEEEPDPACVMRTIRTKNTGYSFLLVWRMAWELQEEVGDQSMGKHVVSKNQGVHGWIEIQAREDYFPIFTQHWAPEHTSLETQADLQEHGIIGGSSPAYTPGPNSIGVYWR